MMLSISIDYLTPLSQKFLKLISLILNSNPENKKGKLWNMS